MALVPGAIDLTDLRLDAVERLIAAATLAGSNVYGGRSAHNPDTTPYAIEVATPGESLDSLSIKEYAYRVDMRLVVSCYASLQPGEGLTEDAADEELSRRLDRMVAQVCAALFKAPDWRDVWRRPPTVEIAHARGTTGRLRLGEAHITITCQTTRRWARDWSDAADLDTITTTVVPYDEANEQAFEDVPEVEFTETAP